MEILEEQHNWYLKQNMLHILCNFLPLLVLADVLDHILTQHYMSFYRLEYVSIVNQTAFYQQIILTVSHVIQIALNLIVSEVHFRIPNSSPILLRRMVGLLELDCMAS